MFLNVFLTASLAALLVLAGGQYKSRPDLSPPKITVTQQIPDLISDDLLFLTPRAPLNKNGQQPHEAQSGAYIFTPQGELVWSGYTYFGTPAFNFQAGKYKGENVIYAFQGGFNPDYGHGHGWVRILNDRYELVAEVRAGRNKLCDLHEFQITESGTGLLEIYQPTQRDLSKVGATSTKQRWVVDALFQEIDIESGRVLFEWSSIDHVPFSETLLHLGLRGPEQATSSSSAWDYFHINSVEKHADGNYIISARHTNTIYKINSTDGSIIWRLGGKKNNFGHGKGHGKGTSFAFQHHARYRGKDSTGRTLISLFDNHNARQGQDHAFVDGLPSSGKLLVIDKSKFTVSLAVQYSAPQKPIISQSQGNLHFLNNGNALIGWGQIPAITEFLSNGTVVYHAEVHFDGESSRAESYRNFKFPWHGVSSEDIAVAWEDSKVYISWNGDTAVERWAVWVNEGGHWRQVEKVKRRGFETAVEVGRQKEVFVEGIDKNGRVLGRSRVLTIEDSELYHAFAIQ